MSANLERGRSRRYKRSEKIATAARELREHHQHILKDVKYIKGGHIEFDPQKGETITPECVQFKIKNENCLNTKSTLSKICDKYNLRVQIPDHKQTFGESTVVRLVYDYK